ncbi:MAG: hypothetical protein WDM76_19560 [Limisphaerales bacterium]
MVVGFTWSARMPITLCETVFQRAGLWVYPKTEHVIDVTGRESLGLVEPQRIEISDREQFKEFGEYRSLEALPAALRIGMTATKKEKRMFPACHALSEPSHHAPVAIVMSRDLGR